MRHAHLALLRQGWCGGGWGEYRFNKNWSRWHLSEATHPAPRGWQISVKGKRSWERRDLRFNLPTALYRSELTSS